MKKKKKWIPILNHLKVLQRDSNFKLSHTCEFSFPLLSTFLLFSDCSVSSHLSGRRRFWFPAPTSQMSMDLASSALDTFPAHKSHSQFFKTEETLRAEQPVRVLSHKWFGKVRKRENTSFKIQNKWLLPVQSHIPLKYWQSFKTLKISLQIYQLLTLIYIFLTYLTLSSNVWVWFSFLA